MKTFKFFPQLQLSALITPQTMNIGTYIQLIFLLGLATVCLSARKCPSVTSLKSSAIPAQYVPTDGKAISSSLAISPRYPCRWASICRGFCGGGAIANASRAARAVRTATGQIIMDIARPSVPAAPCAAASPVSEGSSVGVMDRTSIAAEPG